MAEVDPRPDRLAVVRPLWHCQAAVRHDGHARRLLVCRVGRRGSENFFRALKRNAQIKSGNKQVAQSVASPAMAFGLTDTDDAISEIEKGMPVTIVYPDQRDGEPGTLFIPNTLALIKGSPNPGGGREAARLSLVGRRGAAIGRRPQRPDSAAAGCGGFGPREDAARRAGDEGRLAGGGRQVGRRGRIPEGEFAAAE